MDSPTCGASSEDYRYADVGAGSDPQHAFVGAGSGNGIELSGKAESYRNNTPVTVGWSDITLQVQTTEGEKTILHGLNGHAAPGELVAIMGPSGAGKTSLLNCLAHRHSGFGGEVMYTNYFGVETQPCLKPFPRQVNLNSVPWKESFHSILAYMPQDEIFLAELTVREHLTFMAMLRISSEVIFQNHIPSTAAIFEDMHAVSVSLPSPFCHRFRMRRKRRERRM